VLRIRVASLGYVSINNFDPVDIYPDKPRLFSGITVTKAGGDLPGLMPAYNGNTVIAFLAFKIAIVTLICKGLKGKILILNFGLLNAENIH
jgi:hypothetical protein